MTQLVSEQGGGGPVLAQASSGRRGGVARLAGRVAAVGAVPGLGTWAGVLLSAAGIVLVVVAWGRTAGLTSVALQVPYVLSAGCTGLGLVAVGLTVVSISAKRADALARRQQLQELQALVAELRSALEERR